MGVLVLCHCQKLTMGGWLLCAGMCVSAEWGDLRGLVRDDFNMLWS